MLQFTIYSGIHLILLCSHLPSRTMLFLSFWRCIVCSGRSSSCPAVIIKPDCPSFRFLPFSSISSSSSSQIAPPLNVISDVLITECGFSSSQVATVIGREQKFLGKKSDHTAREAIQFLKDYGFTENKLKGIILRGPGILLRKVDSQWKPKIEFLREIGLTAQDVAHILFYRPRILNLSLEKCLVPRLLHLESLFGSKVHLCKALRSAPGLLTSDFEKQVKPRVEYLKNRLGISEGSATFVRALSVVISRSFETLEVKIKHMLSFGLAEEEIGQMLRTYPGVLILSTKKLKANADFLIHTAGLELKTIFSNPRLLELSVEKRLKPRHEVYKSLKTSPHATGLPSLLRFLRLSERDFLVKFSQYDTQVKSNNLQSPKAGVLEQ